MIQHNKLEAIGIKVIHRMRCVMLAITYNTVTEII